MFIYIQVKAYLERVLFEIPPKQQFSRGFWHIASISSISNKTPDTRLGILFEMQLREEICTQKLLFFEEFQTDKEECVFHMVVSILPPAGFGLTTIEKMHPTLFCELFSFKKYFGLKKFLRVLLKRFFKINFMALASSKIFWHYS